MRRILVIAAVVIVALLLSASFLVADHYQFSNEKPSETTSFYVGVTYCGGNVTEAKLLIDRVKNYTNLFVVQSGSLEKNLAELNEVCAYAVASGLRIIVYFGSVVFNRNYLTDFLNNETWGSNLLGIYFDDEPGGKTLDASNVNLLDYGNIVSRYPDYMTVIQPNGTQITYDTNGTVSIQSDNSSIFYHPDGTILLTANSTVQNEINYVIESNGTAYLLDSSGNVASLVSDPSKLPKIETYNQILAQRPYQTQNEYANSLVTTIQNTTNWFHTQTPLKVFTSDYALYWYDYLGGYDVVLTQLGWNNSETQDIALVRGAANLQGKDWGAIVTWKYNQPPYLGTGQEMYDQMRMAFDAGAKYIVVFNYPTYQDNNPYGILQDEHFSALQKFWSDTVQNKTVTNDGTKAEAVLVLPNNYGSGLRNANDTIWGMWPADNRSQQVWNAIQASISKYGSKLDIVYDDPAHPIAGKYQYVYYWYQTI